MPSSLTRLALVTATALAALAGAPRPARADDTAAASALFDQGKAFFAAGRFQEACDKLQASYELVPLSGTAGLMAACHERLGHLASAWAGYLDAAVLAERSGNLERAAVARARAADLEPRLARLSIELAPELGSGAAAEAPGGLVLTRNGARVPNAALGTPIPVDAGRHVVVATAPGRQRWTATIHIADGEQRAVHIPALAPIAVRATSRPGLSPRAWTGLGLAGAGGAAVLAGAGFGLAARSSWSKAEDAGCTGDGVCPDPESRDLADTAGARADLATFLVAGGAVAAAAGLYLYWTAPSRDEAPPATVSAALGRDRITFAVEGRF